MNDQVDALSYIVKQLEGATVTRKRRNPKVIPLRDQIDPDPQVGYRLVSVDDFLKMIGEQSAPEVSGDQYTRAGARTQEIHRRQQQEFPVSDLEKEGRLLDQLFPERLVPQERNRFSTHLLEVLNGLGKDLGVPQMSKSEALRLGKAIHSMTQGQDLGASKYEPREDLQESVGQPTVNLKVIWTDPSTGETLFEMDPLTLQAGARLHLRPLDGEGWAAAQVTIEVDSVDHPGYQEYLQRTANAPLPYVGQQEFQIRGLRGHFDFNGKRTTCIMGTINGRMGEGLSRCHPDDDYDLATGRKLSFSRALSQIVGDPSVRQRVWDEYFTQYPEDKTARSTR